MSEWQKISLWIALIIAIILGIIWQFFPLQDAENRLEQLPPVVERVTSVDLPETPQEQEFFANVNMIKRVYQIGDKRIFIYVLDGTHNRHAVHDPTYCFRGGGWEIVGMKSIPLPKGGTGMLYQLVKDKQTNEALLWFSDGKQKFSSPLRYWITTALRRLTLGYSGPEPILIVLQPIDGKPVDWEKVLAEFPQLQDI